MRQSFRAWMESQGYTAGTIATHSSQSNRLEAAYGSLDEVIANGGYEALFEELSYSAEDERRNRPNKSKLQVGGNLRSNLASYKASLACYRRYYEAAAGDPITNTTNADLLSNAPADTPEKQRLSLERDMQTALRQNITSLEAGLTIIDDGMERAVLSGFIDILARDANGALVVIELKAGKTDARVIGQTLGYMGDIAAEEDAPSVRGIIVASAFDQRTTSAARAVSNLSLMRYHVSFTFEPAP